MRKGIFFIIAILCLGLLIHNSDIFTSPAPINKTILKSGGHKRIPRGVYDLRVLSGEMQLSLQPHMSKGEIYKNYCRSSLDLSYPIVNGKGKVLLTKAKRALIKDKSFSIKYLGLYQGNTDVWAGTYLITLKGNLKDDQICLNISDFDYMKENSRMTNSKDYYLNSRKKATTIKIRNKQWLDISYEGKGKHRPFLLHFRRVKQ